MSAVLSRNYASLRFYRPGLAEGALGPKAVRSAKATIPLRPTFTSHGVGTRLQAAAGDSPTNRHNLPDSYRANLPRRTRANAYRPITLPGTGADWQALAQLPTPSPVRRSWYGPGGIK